MTMKLYTVRKAMFVGGCVSAIVAGALSMAGVLPDLYPWLSILGLGVAAIAGGGPSRPS